MDLTEYSILKISHGGEWDDDDASTILLQGSLAPGDVFVLCNKQFDLSLSSECDYVANTADAVNIDGGDAIGLAHFSTVIDAIGQAGASPDGSWQLLGTLSTRQHTLQRKQVQTIPLFEIRKCTVHILCLYGDSVHLCRPYAAYLHAKCTVHILCLYGDTVRLC